MSKANSNNGNTGSHNNGKTSSHPGPGGNWPSKTPNPSGGGRGNAAPKK